MKVTFNQAVDEDSALSLDNYVISKNGTEYGTDTSKYTDIDTLLETAPNNVAFDEETNTVIFRLDAALANGDKYSIDVTDGVLSEDKSTKVGRYAGEEKTFTDTAAPQLVKAEKTASNYLKLTFNEPVAAGLTATVDGTPVTLAAPSTAIGVYTVQSAAPLADDLKASGTHNVSVYNATDVAEPNDNSVSILTGSFTVTGDTTAPVFVEAEQVTADERSFDLVFSEPVSFDDTKLVIKKGNFTFPVVDGVNSPGYSLSYFAADGVTSVAQTAATVVRVTFAADDLVNYANNLYDAGTNSVSLSVTAENFKDAVNLVGTKTTKTVNLSKDLAAPTVTSKYDNSIVGTLDPADATDTDGKLVLKFNKVLQNGSLDATKFVVTDKDGITRSVTSATAVNSATDKEVELVITDLQDRDALEAKAPFTVRVAASAVKASNNLGNSAFTTEVPKSSSTVSPVTEAVNDGATTVSNNVITVTYKEAMDASAVNLANYTLDGAAFPTGTTISINGDNTVVTITLPAGYTNKTISKLFGISKNVKTASGSVVVGNVSSKVAYTKQLTFTDNTKPVLTSAKFLVASESATATKRVKLTFSENLGALGSTDLVEDLNVTVNGSKATVADIEDGTSGDKVLTLVTASDINISQPVVITVAPVAAGTANTAADIEDAAGNDLVEGTQVTVAGTELDAGAIAADAAVVATAKANLTLSVTNEDQAVSTITLPATQDGATVTWEVTSGTGVINPATLYTTPARTGSAVTEELTATITKGSATDTLVFEVVVASNEDTDGDTGNGVTVLGDTTVARQ